MCKIFILEDNKEINDILFEWLVQQEIVTNNEVVIENNFADGINKLETLLRKDEIPIVFLINLNLSAYENNKKEGIEFIKLIRKKNINTSILLITEDELTRNDYIILSQLYIDGIIQKPINFDILYFHLINILYTGKDYYKLFSKELKDKMIYLEKLVTLLEKMDNLEKIINYRGTMNVIN